MHKRTTLNIHLNMIIYYTHLHRFSEYKTHISSHERSKTRYVTQTFARFHFSNELPCLPLNAKLRLSKCVIHLHVLY